MTKKLRITASILDVRGLIMSHQEEGCSVGFVPTMGSLHDGHISLVEKSSQENHITVVSIFVNPTQFNEKRDFEVYPRNIDDDLKILGDYPVDLVFTPDAREIYPKPDKRIFDFGGLDRIMEGKHRPGHFNGVAQVVSRFFEIITPDRAYFGEKDFQQMAIIQKMTMDLQLPVKIIACPIIRDEDGLAKSSRNKLLSAEERKSASRIPESMNRAKEQIGQLSVQQLIEQTIVYLHEDPQLETEYFEIVDAKSLKPIADWSARGQIRACIAVRIGNVRLIDNMDFSL